MRIKLDDGSPPPAPPPASVVGFEAVYRREYPGAVRLAFLLTGDAMAAEDVVQDAFTRLHQRFDTVLNPGGYLRVAVINGCRERGRRSGREQRYLHLARPTANDLLAAGADGDTLLDAVAHLPYAQRAAIVLRYWADLPEREIAEALDVRPTTVRTLIHRGLGRLRKEIDR